MATEPALDLRHFSQSEIRRVIEKIIAEENLYSVFQGIIDLPKKEIHGFEALIRGPQDSLFHSPLQLFSAARACGLETELEILCRKVTIRDYAKLQLNQKLFLNISPSILLRPGFKKGKTLEFLKQYHIDPQQVVIEITEYQETENYRLLKAAIDHYRGMGFRVALDDLGSGYSSLKLWSELLPEYIKVDSHFIRHIDSNPVKTSFVRSLHSMAKASHCKIIAEGVEVKEEYQMLQKIGIGLIQGYYFSRPTTKPCPEVALKRLTPEKNQLQLILDADSDDNISVIADKLKPMHSCTPVRTIMDIFQQDENLQTIPIVDGDQPLGLVDRNRFFNRLMATRFGPELYGKNPIKTFLDTETMSVDINSDLESVSQILTENAHRDGAFIITHQDKYFGVATVIGLLEKMTRQKIHNAQHANPLTLLPGMVPVNNSINKLLKSKTPFSVAYVDLDHFKPYNDVYGYEAGDKIIKDLAELLYAGFPKASSLVGHIGGDDFIVVNTGENYLSDCEFILDSFSQKANSYYLAEHRKAGGIHTLDRRGQPAFFPLLSLSVGIVPPEATASCESHIGISDLATEAKRQAKLKEGQSCFINRRKIASEAFRETLILTP